MDHAEFIKWAVGLTITIVLACGSAIFVMLKVAFKMGAQDRQNIETSTKVENATKTLEQVRDKLIAIPLLQQRIEQVEETFAKHISTYRSDIKNLLRKSWTGEGEE